MSPLGGADEPRFADQAAPPEAERRRWRVDHSVTAWGAAALCAFVASVAVAPGWSGVLGGVLAVVMLAIAATDAREFIIPDKLVFAALGLGLLGIPFVHTGSIAVSLGSAVLRALLVAALFLGFRLTYRWIRGYDGLGLGDVKLAAVAGLWLDWMSAAIAVDIAALSALGFVLIGIARGRKVSRQTRIPFGLFFAPAIWLAWLLAATIFR